MSLDELKLLPMNAAIAKVIELADQEFGGGHWGILIQRGDDCTQWDWALLGEPARFHITTKDPAK